MYYKATKDAGKTAGLNVTLINETTAAAFAYGLGIKGVKTYARTLINWLLLYIN